MMKLDLTYFHILEMLDFTKLYVLRYLLTKIKAVISSTCFCLTHVWLLLRFGLFVYNNDTHKKAFL